MKNFLIISTIICTAIIACNKESNNSELKIQRGDFSSNTIDTTICSSDTLLYSFGYFGDEEGISIVSQPKYSRSCEILNKQWEERILQYIPQSDFVGTDNISVVTSRGSDGASPSTDVDTILIIIDVIKD